MSAEVEDTPELKILPGFEPMEEALVVASASELAKLHGTLAKAMRNRIKSGRATAAEWSAAAKFLADNDVNSKMGQSEAVDELRKKLAANQSRLRQPMSRDALDAAAERADKGMK